MSEDTHPGWAERMAGEHPCGAPVPSFPSMDRRCFEQDAGLEPQPGPAGFHVHAEARRRSVGLKADQASTIRVESA